MATAEELKVKGNEYYRVQKYTEAVQCYSDALVLSPQHPVILSNRSAAYWKLNKYSKALDDAEECIRVKPDWAKAHLRRVVALNSLKEYKRAKDAAVVGFKLYDLNLSKDFIGEWMKSSKAQMNPETCSILQKKPHFFFYPDGIDSFCDQYSEILLDVVMAQMPSKTEGVIGQSHQDMVRCVEGTVNIIESVLIEFGQPACKALTEWKERVVMDVDAFQLQSQEELMQTLDGKSQALATWLQNEVHPALLAILSPTLLLVPVTLLARSLALRCMNTGHFSLEYFAHACLALFEDNIYDHPRYYATFVALLFLILFSYGSIEIWDLKALELVQVTCVKIQRLMEDMPKDTKGYDILMEEYSGNLSVYLDMKITQISESAFKHDPAGTATDLETILLVLCREDPIKARRAVDEQLAEIVGRNTPTSDSHMKLLDAQNLLLMTGIYVKLGDHEQALEVFHKGKTSGLSLLADLIQNALASFSEISSAVAELRHFILCAASFLQSHFPSLTTDTFIQWKNLFSEIHSVFIRLGLRANNRILFQVLRDPLLLESEEEQLNAFEFHQSSEKIFIQKYFSYVLQALAVQNHKQVLDALEPEDALLDYLFDVYHPDFDPGKEPRNAPLCFVTLLQKDRPPSIFQLDLSSVHKAYGSKGGEDITYSELSTLCSTLGEHILPTEVCKILGERKVQRLLISPDSYLHDLPLEATSANIGKPGTFLFEHFNVVRLSSPRELLREQVVASLRLLLDPSLGSSQSPLPTIPDDALYFKLLGILRSSDIITTDLPETLIAEAFCTCGFQSQLPKSTIPTPDSISPDLEIPFLVKPGVLTLPMHSNLSPVLLKALQNSAMKNIESLRNRAANLEQQSSGTLNPKTKSLNVDCYLIGNPKFDMDVEPREDLLEVGCIAALTSMFWFSDLQPVKVKVDELPETQREVDAVDYHLSLSENLHVKQPITGSNATVTSLLELESPFVLHIATHGQFQSLMHTQAHMSYWCDTSTALLLAGAHTCLNKQYNKLSFHSGLGCLTPASACAINLEGTRLAFSSSCHSGVGTKPFHETSQSMMQAFSAAGAQTVISTLWAVDDSLTADFASSFYDQLVKKSTCHPSEALTLARKLVKDRQEPLSAWGAFFCSGIDRPLFPMSTTKAQEIQMVADYIHAKRISVGEGQLTGFEAKESGSRIPLVADLGKDSRPVEDAK